MDPGEWRSIELSYLARLRQRHARAAAGWEEPRLVRLPPAQPLAGIARLGEGPAPAAIDALRAGTADIVSAGSACPAEGTNVRLRDVLAQDVRVLLRGQGAGNALCAWLAGMCARVGWAYTYANWSFQPVPLIVLSGSGADAEGSGAEVQQGAPPLEATAATAAGLIRRWTEQGRLLVLLPLPRDGRRAGWWRPLEAWIAGAGCGCRVVLVTGEEDIAFPLARWFTHYRLAPAATEKSSPLRKARIAAREAWPSLESTDPDVRLTAVEAAVQGSEARRVSVLIAALRDFWHEVRAVAAIGLGLIGEPETVPALAMAMGDPHPGVRTAAVNAIGQIGGVRARAVLAGGLGAYYPEVRLAAALALGLAGSATLRPIAAAATAGAYVGCIPPGGMSVRTAVLGVAAQMGAASPHSAGHILPLLLGAARDECVWVRAAAAEALGFLGAFGGTECAQAAARLLGDSEAQVRRAALVGLMRMGSAAAPALLAALGDRDPAVRWLTVHLLGRLASEELAAGEMAGCEAAGESAPNEKVVAALAAALKDPYAAVRWLAAETLVEIRSASPTAAEALLLARQDRNPLVRAAAQSSSRAGKAAVGEP